jgi:hypothetical protein
VWAFLEVSVILGLTELQQIYQIPFFNVTLSNIITWSIIAAAWYSSYIRQSQIFKDRIENLQQGLNTARGDFQKGLDVIQKWIDIHENEARARDTSIHLLEINNAKLGVLVERADLHFSKLEEVAMRVLKKES